MKVTDHMRYWLLAGIAVLLVLLLGIAWIAGGRQPIREIAQPVAVPELPR